MIVGAENFTCTSGEIVSSEVICDFKSDCADKSDEYHCRKFALKQIYNIGLNCQFMNLDIKNLFDVFIVSLIDRLIYCCIYCITPLLIHVVVPFHLHRLWLYRSTTVKLLIIFPTLSSDYQQKISKWW